MREWKWSEKRKKLDVIGKYLVVGGTATIIDFSIFMVMANIFNVHYLVANSVSYSIGLVFNYYISREWVFEKKNHNFARDFTLYVITSLLGLAINNLIIYLLVDYHIFEMAVNLVVKYHNDDITKLSSKLAATIVVLIWNYITKKHIVFR